MIFPPGFARASALFALALCVLAGARAQSPITRAIDVRNLSVAEAGRGLEVKLRGIIVFHEATSAFLQDETSTTFFRPSPGQNISIGDEVEIQGRTRMGLYLPGVGTVELTVLRPGPVPRGIPVTYDDVVSTRYHYQRVEINGIVRSITPAPGNRSVLRLLMGSRILEVRVEVPPGAGAPAVDSRVRIAGLAAGFINLRRQVVQPYVRVQNWSDVTILRPARPTAEVPRISGEELLAFRPSGAREHRVAVTGIATAVLPNGVIFLQDGDTGFGAHLSTASGLAVGDRVELLGFPEMDRFTPSLMDAEVVKRTPGAAPEPLPVGSPEHLNGTHNARLVSVTAVLDHAFTTQEGVTLVLSDRNRSIQASTSDLHVVTAPGARVRVTGICQVEGGPSNSFSSAVAAVSLRVRDAGDVVVLQAPSWWTVQRLATMLAGLAGVTLLAALWIAVLRRQMRRQTAALRHRIESGAALEERQRIAREFHDTLEQELAGVSLRLDALATRVDDEKGKTLITASRNLVSRIQTETRDLISDLRDPSETAGDLAAALAGVASRLSSTSGVDVAFQCSPPIPPLPAATVHGLRMIARESVNNALKHGAALHVTIHLEASPTQLTLRIIDDGCGFDPAHAAMTRSGHFGCAGMRERGRKIHAEISWHRTPPQGTTVQVVLPLGKRERAEFYSGSESSSFTGANPNRQSQPAI